MRLTQRCTCRGRSHAAGVQAACAHRAAVCECRRFALPFVRAVFQVFCVAPTCPTHPQSPEEHEVSLQMRPQHWRLRLRLWRCERSLPQPFSHLWISKTRLPIGCQARPGLGVSPGEGHRRTPQSQRHKQVRQTVRTPQSIERPACGGPRHVQLECGRKISDLS